jgi:hypothetical protein
MCVRDDREWATTSLFFALFGLGTIGGMIISRGNILLYSRSVLSLEIERTGSSPIHVVVCSVLLECWVQRLKFGAGVVAGHGGSFAEGHGRLCMDLGAGATAGHGLEHSGTTTDLGLGMVDGHGVDLGPR